MADPQPGFSASAGGFEALSREALEFYEKVAAPTYARLPAEAGEVTVRRLASRRGLSVAETEAIVAVLRTAPRPAPAPPEEPAPRPASAPRAATRQAPPVRRPAPPPSAPPRAAPPARVPPTLTGRQRLARFRRRPSAAKTAIAVAWTLVCVALFGVVGYIAYDRLHPKKPAEADAGPQKPSYATRSRPPTGGPGADNASGRIAASGSEPKAIEPPPVLPPVPAPVAPVVPPPPSAPVRRTHALAECKAALKAELPSLEASWQALPRAGPKQTEANWVDIGRLARLEALLVASFACDEVESARWKPAAPEKDQGLGGQAAAGRTGPRLCLGLVQAAAASVGARLAHFSWKGVEGLLDGEAPAETGEASAEQWAQLGRARIRRWLALAEEHPGGAPLRGHVQGLRSAEALLEASPGRPLAAYLQAAVLETDVLALMAGMEPEAAKPDLAEAHKALYEDDARCTTLVEQLRNAERCRIGALLHWAQAWTEERKK